MKILALWPNYYDETWVSYSLKSLMLGFQASGHSIEIFSLANGKQELVLRPSPLMPAWALRLFQRLVQDRLSWLVYKVQRSIKPRDIAYIWLEGSPSSVERLRSRGAIIVREMINCSAEFRRARLNAAYDRLGLNPPNFISQEEIDAERLALLAADFIFCPNPFVYDSVLAYGVPASRCLRVSYGWDERSFNTQRSAPVDHRLRVLFVGTVDVRKGAAELLEAWELANIDGVLTIAGKVNEVISHRYSGVLSRSDVFVLGHVADVSSLYSAADVFVFPSWEEGGPMVTLEALAHGVVPVTTAMGSSGAYNAGDGVGIVVPDGDVGAIVQALQRLDRDRQLLADMAAAATLRAQDYHWKNVGEKRARLLQESISVLNFNSKSARIY